MLLLVTGLGLQFVLLVVLFRRGFARLCPWFTALIGFYAVRAALLVALPAVMSAAQASVTARATTGRYISPPLALIDELLQLAVLAGLVQTLVPRLLARLALGGMNPRRAALVVSTAATAFALLAMFRFGDWPTSVNLAIVLSNADLLLRVVFIELLMLSLFIAADRVPARASLAIARGFGIFALVSLVAGQMQLATILNRNYPVYVLLAYCKIAAYLATVVYWIVVFVRASASDSPGAAGLQHDGVVEP